MLIWSCHSKDELGDDSDLILSPPLGVVFSAVDGTSSVASFFDLSRMRVVSAMNLPGYIITASGQNLAADRLVLADARDDRIAIFQMPGMNLTHLGNLGGAPMDIEPSFGAGFVYAISRNGSFWIDSVAAGTFDTLEIALFPRRLTLRPPDQDQAWIVNESRKIIQIVLLSTEEMFDSMRFTEPPTDVSFSPDGATAFVSFAGPQSGITAYSATSHQAEANYPIAGTGPFDLAMSDDGEYLAAADSSQGDVNILHLQGGDLWSVHVGSDAGLVRFAHESHILYALAPVDNQVKRIQIGTDGPVLVDSVAFIASPSNMILWEKRN
jgi:hypothetical protein